MGLSRRLKRNNNMAGLKAQLLEKENEIFTLSNQMDMQKMYLTEMGKISTALKDIIVRELKLTEKEVTDLLEKELDTVDAGEVDKLVDAADNIELTDPVDSTEPATEVTEPIVEEDKPKADKKPAKKKATKKEIKDKE